jgi:gamma-glutamyltranspeptidase/glutathione hydrolase
MKRALHVFLILLFFLPSFPFAASRRPLEGKKVMVASVHELASGAGVEIMQKGGNAIDAAVGISFVLAVVWPEAGNLGGGGFMLIRKADGTEEAIDYRERAPLAATRDMYLDSKGNVIENASTIGHKASAVPGTIAGLTLALQRHGKLPWKELIEPARKLAEEGYLLSPMVVERTLKHEKTLSFFPETKRIFLRNGKHYEPGERFIQPELAKTLARIQQQGPREFYEGETATLIIKEMKENGGLITAKDLKEYEATIRKPIHGTYRDYEIVTMPPPSSGGIALIQMLNMLESFDLASASFHSTGHLHRMVEVMKRAFADRAVFLGDRDFVRVPVEELISKEHAIAAVKTINSHRATPSTKIKPLLTQLKESANTTHFSVIDAEGNVVANTFTLNDSFGSAVTVRGAGFLLNNEMDDFTSKPGTPNFYGLMQSELNAIAPRKRPLSSMTPVIVLKQGKPFLTMGSPGGPVIISAVTQVLLNIVDFGMNAQQAVDAPRFHHQWMPDEIYFEPFGLNKDAQRALELRGHKFAKKYFFRETDYLGDVQLIIIDPKTGNRLGASDPRRGGAPAGY